MLSASDRDAVINLLRATGLPTETDFSAVELYDTMLLDKKFSGGKLHLIVPCAIGKCIIIPVTPFELRDWLENGYE